MENDDDAPSVYFTFTTLTELYENEVFQNWAKKHWQNYTYLFPDRDEEDDYDYGVGDTIYWNGSRWVTCVGYSHRENEVYYHDMYKDL